MLSIQQKVAALLLCLIHIAAQDGHAQTVTDVCLGYSERIGVPSYPDPDEVFQTRYTREFYVDDRNARINGVRSCNDINSLTFKGYMVRYSTTPDETVHQYGTMDTTNPSNCNGNTGTGQELFCICDWIDIDDEIVRFAAYPDSNDVEGLLFITDADETIRLKANYAISTPEPPMQLQGRALGFRVEFGHTGFDALTIPDQIMYVEVMYNSCMCPTSEFLGTTQPDDMQITAERGGAQYQTLDEQLHTIGQQYDQSCGTYTVTLDPPMTGILQLYSNGGEYVDTMQLGPVSMDHVGVYDVTMTIEQVEANGDGYFEPVRGFMQSVSYTFRVTVNPCVLATVFRVPNSTQTITYQIGDPTKLFGPYSFTQVPSCNLEPTVRISGLPSFIEHNPNNNSFKIESTLDTNLIGSYSFLIIYRVTGRTDVNDPTQVDRKSQSINYVVRVDPCGVTEVTTPVTVGSQTYNIGDAGYTFGEILFESDSACEVVFNYELTGAPGNLVYSLDDMNFELQQSFDSNLSGGFLTRLTGSVTDQNGDSISAFIEFTVYVNPCQVNSLTVSPSSLTPITYTIEGSGFSFGDYTCSQQDKACGYEQQISVTGLPNFIENVAEDGNFVLSQSNDSTKAGLYSVTLTCSISFLDGWRSTAEIIELSSELNFEVRVNPCQVTGYQMDFSKPIGPVTYTLGGPGQQFGPYGFVQTPDCGYTETVTIEDLPEPYVEHDPASKTFTLDSVAQADGTGFVGSYTVTVRSEFIQTDYTLSETTVQATLQFQIDVSNCLVDEITSQASLGDFEYVLGGPAIENIGPYSFQQVPDCGYTATIRIDNAPPDPYLVHSTADSEFTVPQTTILDSDFLGTYTVGIVYQMENYNGGNPSGAGTPTGLTEFTLTVTPCTVDSLDVTSNAIGAVVSYSLDSPSISFGPYAFAQIPNCGYVMRETRENLPPEPFLVFDEGTSIFTIERSTDTDQIGVYQVVIRKQFDQLTGVGDATTVIEQTIEFELRVEACTVLTFEAIQRPADAVDYTLGQPSFDTDAYEFEQTPDCGYATTISFVDLPGEPLVTHSEVDRTLTIAESSDQDFIGIYNVQIISELQQLDVDQNLVTLTATIEFVLTVNPCLVEEFSVVQSPIPIVPYVLGEDPITFGPYEFQQTPNCGYPMTVTFENLPLDPPFVVHNEAERTFSIATTSDPDFLGEYAVTINSQFEQLALDKSTSPVTQTTSFTLSVTPCQVISLNGIWTPDPAEIRYTLNTPGFSFGPYEFVAEHDCGYPISVQQIENLPDAYVTHDPSTRTFTIAETNESEFFGVYNVIISGQVEQLNTDRSTTPVLQTVEFTLTVNPCSVGAYLVVSPTIDPILYTLDEPSLIGFGQYEFQQQPACGYAETVDVTFSPSTLYVSHEASLRQFTIDRTDEDEFVGIYDVTVVGSFDQPDIDNVMSTVTQTIQFQITVSPCIVNVFEESSSVISAVAYTLGDLSKLNFRPFGFAQTPDCGYPQTVTVQGLAEAPFVEYDESGQNFSIQQTFDMAFLGTYEIQITSVFDQPQILAPAVPIQASITFTIDVNPCQVISFVSPTDIGIVQYTIGDPGFVFGGYQFVQTPLCGYTPVVRVSGPLPPFVSHQAGSSDFVLSETDDLSVLGEETSQDWDVTVTSTISIPDDNSKSPTYTDTESSITFTISALNPCEFNPTVIEPFSIDDMESTVKGPAVTQDLHAVRPQDSVSQALGDKTGLTYCGERFFRIVSSGHENFLSYNESTQMLTLLSNDFDDEGEIEVTVEAYLVYNLFVESTQATFKVKLTECQVTELQPEQTDQQAYEVGSGAKTFSLAPFTQVPQCEADVTYTIQQSPQGQNQFESLPSWIVQNLMQLTVNTENFDLIGVYELRVVGQATSGPQSAPPMTFRLDIGSPNCQQEELTSTTSPEPIEYQIGISDPAERTFSWFSNTPEFNCPRRDTITIQENGQSRAPTAEDLTVISYSENDNLILQIDTENFELDGRSWNIVVTRTSELSQSDKKEAAQIVQVTFRDSCWDSELVAPKFISSSIFFKLYEQQEIFFENMQNLSQGPTFCGGFTYSLVYESGPLSLEDLTSVYEISPAGADRHVIRGEIQDQRWFGPHVIRIRGTNGVAPSNRLRELQSGSTRGNNGLFNSIFSDPMTIEIENPCLDTVLNPDRNLRVPQSLTVPVGDTEATWQILGTEDSISVAFGSGYNLCGNRVYELLTPDGLPYLSDSFSMVIEDSDASEGADLINFTLQSFEEGPIYTKLVKVDVYLERYTDKRISFPLELGFRECYASGFGGSPIEKQRIEVGQQPYEIDLVFNQTPCQFTQTYIIEVIDVASDKQLPIPGFITLNLNSGGQAAIAEDDDEEGSSEEGVDPVPASLRFGTTARSDVGEYKVRVTSQLLNYFQNATSIEFRVVVYAPTDGFDWSLKPLVEVNLVDQRVNVGEALLYQPDFKIEPNGWEQTMFQVNLGRAGKFTIFDEETREFRAPAILIEPVDVGKHLVVVTIRFVRQNEIVTFKESFHIEVIGIDDDGEVDPDPKVPSDWKNLPVWDKEIEENLIPEELEAEPEKPIPYISRLTETGVLTIGWDREMDPPQKYEIIPEEKVAVEDYSRFSEREIEERLEFQWFKDDEENRALRLALIDAMEIRITREDPEAELEPIEFTWDILSYGQYQITIQLMIQNAEQISADFGQPDNLSVTFWGTEYFQSKEGEEVRYGSEVQTKILRQINYEEAEQLESGLVYVKAYIIFIVLLIMGFFSLGSLLPMWIFVNSLQIITHTTLLNTMMPGNAFLVLKQYLDLVRLNWPALNEAIYDRRTSVELGTDVGFYNVFFQACDYAHFFTHNLVIVSFTCALIALIWIILSIKDCIGKRPAYVYKHRFYRRRHEPSVNNFALRFFYEMFLEFCLCVLINISIHKTDSFSSFGQWVLCIIFACVILGYMAWLISLFFYNGPFLENFYFKSTFFKSFMMARPINPTFDAQNQLRRLQEKLERQRLREIKMEKLWHIKNLQMTKQKVTPLDLNMIGLINNLDLNQEGQRNNTMPTRRQLLSPRNGDGSFIEDSHRTAGNQSYQSEARTSQRAGRESMPTKVVTNPDILFTGASQGPIKSVKGQPMPLITDLLSDQDIDVGKQDHHQEGLVFSENGNRSSERIKEGKTHFIDALLHHDNSVDNKVNTARGSATRNQRESFLAVNQVSSMKEMDTVCGDNADFQSPRTFQTDQINHFSQRKIPIVLPPSSDLKHMASDNDSISAFKEQEGSDHSNSLDDQRQQQQNMYQKRESLILEVMSATNNNDEKGNSPDPRIENVSRFNQQKRSNTIPKLGLLGEELEQQYVRSKTSLAKNIQLFNGQKGSGDEANSQGQPINQQFQRHKTGSFNKYKTPAFLSPNTQSQKPESGASAAFSPLSFSKEKESAANLPVHQKRDSIDSSHNSDQKKGPYISSFAAKNAANGTQEQEFFEGGEGQQIEEEMKQQPSNERDSLASASKANNYQYSDRRSQAVDLRRKARRKTLDPDFRYFMKQKIGKGRNLKIRYKQKQQHEEVIVANAKEIVAAAELIQKPARFKTLYYGLKMNHPRNVALIHPLMFSVRRIIYALSIVLLAQYALFGAWILLVGTILMLAFAITEMPWNDPVINAQHIFNEITTYIVCIFLLLFNNYLDAYTRHNLAYVLVGFVTIFLVYNGIMMLRKVTKLILLIFRKWRMHRQQRSLWAEARLIAKKIRGHLGEKFGKNLLEQTLGDDDFVDDERPKLQYDQLIELEMIGMTTGGIRLNIGQNEKKRALFEQELMMADQSSSKIPWQLSQLKDGKSQEEISDQLENSLYVPYDAEDFARVMQSPVVEKNGDEYKKQNTAKACYTGTSANIMVQETEEPLKLIKRSSSQRNIPLDNSDQKRRSSLQISADNKDDKLIRTFNDMNHNLMEVPLVEEQEGEKLKLVPMNQDDNLWDKKSEQKGEKRQQHLEEINDHSVSFTESQKRQRSKQRLEKMTTTEKKRKNWFKPERLAADKQFMKSTERIERFDTKHLPVTEKTISLGSPLNSKRQNDSADSLNEENMLRVLETPHNIEHRVKRCRTERDLRQVQQAEGANGNGINNNISLKDQKSVIRRAESAVQDIASQPVFQTWTSACGNVDTITEEKYEGSIVEPSTGRREADSAGLLHVPLTEQHAALDSKSEQQAYYDPPYLSEGNNHNQVDDDALAHIDHLLQGQASADQSQAVAPPNDVNLDMKLPQVLPLKTEDTKEEEKVPPPAEPEEQETKVQQQEGLLALAEQDTEEIMQELLQPQDSPSQQNVDIISDTSQEEEDEEDKQASEVQPIEEAEQEVSMVDSPQAEEETKKAPEEPERTPCGEAVMEIMPAATQDTPQEEEKKMPQLSRSKPARELDPYQMILEQSAEYVAESIKADQRMTTKEDVDEEQEQESLDKEVEAMIAEENERELKQQNSLLKVETRQQTHHSLASQVNHISRQHGEHSKVVNVDHDLKEASEQQIEISHLLPDTPCVNADKDKSSLNIDTSNQREDSRLNSADLSQMFSDNQGAKKSSQEQLMETETDQVEEAKQKKQAIIPTRSDESLAQKAKRLFGGQHDIRIEEQAPQQPPQTAQENVNDLSTPALIDLQPQPSSPDSLMEAEAQPKARTTLGTAQGANRASSDTPFAAQIDQTSEARRDAAQSTNSNGAQGCRSMPREAEHHYFSPLADRVIRPSESGGLPRLSPFSAEPKIPPPFSGAKPRPEPATSPDLIAFKSGPQTRNETVVNEENKRSLQQQKRGLETVAEQHLVTGGPVNLRFHDAPASSGNNTAKHSSQAFQAPGGDPDVRRAVLTPGTPTHIIEVEPGVDHESSQRVGSGEPGLRHQPQATMPYESSDLNIFNDSPHSSSHSKTYAINNNGGGMRTAHPAAGSSKESELAGVELSAPPNMTQRNATASPRVAVENYLVTPGGARLLAQHREQLQSSVAQPARAAQQRFIAMQPSNGNESSSTMNGLPLLAQYREGRNGYSAYQQSQSIATDQTAAAMQGFQVQQRKNSSNGNHNENMHIDAERSDGLSSPQAHQSNYRFSPLSNHALTQVRSNEAVLRSNNNLGSSMLPQHHEQNLVRQASMMMLSPQPVGIQRTFSPPVVGSQYDVPTISSIQKQIERKKGNKLKNQQQDYVHSSTTRRGKTIDAINSLANKRHSYDVECNAFGSEAQKALAYKSNGSSSGGGNTMKGIFNKPRASTKSLRRKSINKLQRQNSNQAAGQYIMESNGKKTMPLSGQASSIGGAAAMRYLNSQRNSGTRNQER